MWREAEKDGARESNKKNRYDDERENEKGRTDCRRKEGETRKGVKRKKGERFPETDC